MSLAGITATAPVLPKRGLFICLVGPAGTGKSSLAAEFPSPEAIIDPRDEGMVDLAHEGLISIPLERIHKSTSFLKYRSNLEASLASSSKTIICESITGIQALCHDEACKMDYEGDRSTSKFYNYQAGPRTAADKYFQQLLDLMLKAQNLGKHVILIGHTVANMEKNQEGEDYLATFINADKQVTSRIRATFQNILVIVEVAETYKKGSIVKSQDTSSRWIYPHANNKYPSKNRLGLRSPIKYPEDQKQAYLEIMKAMRRDPKTGYRKAA